MLIKAYTRARVALAILYYYVLRNTSTRKGVTKFYQRSCSGQKFWTKFRFITTLNFGNSLKKTAPLTLNLILPPFIYRHYLTARSYRVATLEVSYLFYHSTAQMTDSFNYIQNTSFVPSALMT